MYIKITPGRKKIIVKFFNIFLNTFIEHVERNYHLL